MARASSALDRLDRLLQQSDGMVRRYGLPILHTLEADIRGVAEYILPALEGETDTDRRIRALLLKAARESGLSWVSDVRVRLDRPCASLPLVPGIPFMFGPSDQSETLIGLPGFFHEFGHSLYRTEGVFDAIRSVLSRHFEDIATESGPQSYEKGAAWDRRLDAAQHYWTRARISEAFCDVFATYVCGPAYLATAVDLGISLGKKSYQVGEDVHPPWEARVSLCKLALTSSDLQSDTTSAILSTWDTYVQGTVPTAEYSLACSQDLLQELVAESVRQIGRAEPNCIRFVGGVVASKGPVIPGRTNVTAGLNEALRVLVFEPSRYRTYERDLLESYVSWFPDPDGDSADGVPK
jgi:hypothetical protein